jgi:hypothetical protein
MSTKSVMLDINFNDRLRFRLVHHKQVYSYDEHISAQYIALNRAIYSHKYIIRVLLKVMFRLHSRLTVKLQ